MSKKLLQRLLPSPEKIASMKIMKWIGADSLAPNLWYINRKSVSQAVFIGTFFGLLPVPFHSVFILLTVLYFEVNLPIGLTLAWLSNPITLVPILYIGFWIGTKFFNIPMINQQAISELMHQTMNWIEHFGHGKVDLSLVTPLLTGLVIEALIFAIVLFALTRLFWRANIIYQWRRRKRP